LLQLILWSIRVSFVDAHTHIHSSLPIPQTDYATGNVNNSNNNNNINISGNIGADQQVSRGVSQQQQQQQQQHVYLLTFLIDEAFDDYCLAGSIESNTIVSQLSAEQLRQLCVSATTATTTVTAAAATTTTTDDVDAASSASNLGVNACWATVFSISEPNRQDNNINDDHGFSCDVFSGGVGVMNASDGPMTAL
jgi:hypothetical protein